MISDDFSGIDIDLLADYVGGALDGDDADRVARLVADDPAWREAYRMLVPGMTAAATDLRDLGSAPEPMPADVVARLDAALRSPATLSSPIAEPDTIPPALMASAEPHLIPVRGETHPTAGSGEPHLTPVRGEPSPVAVPGGTVHRGRPRRSPARRRLRWAAPIAAAAGVLAFAGVGVDYLADRPGSNAETSAGGSADLGAPMIAAEAAGLVSGLTDENIRASGADYGATALSAPAPAPAGGTMAQPDASDDLRKRTSEKPESRNAMAPDPGFPELQRLRSRDALLACLEAIASEQGSGPIVVQLVDYARYQGRPAVVVQFSAGGANWSWASGAACGTVGAGADRLGRVRVG
ncbi:hypothetical protein [Jidongwangia harbinensis]|uniref:hypothetical protein n=1 Tax=Jidongwangia harbinensis TaxID=2878561 RepID=UPI001CDA0B3B|nr:hypothetical protein [Jidongwangia harbinensis]MCA2212723.1 hypothetical protein [Jidongwangia harbinensis]